MSLEVDVGSETYIVYADVETADAYHGGSAHGETWRSASTDDKGRALVTATRTLDRQSWKTEYNTFALREDIEAIQQASMELALALLDGSDVQNSPTNEQLVASISAGSVSITNFRNSAYPTRFPQIVHELLRPYLGGTGTGTMFGKVNGVDTETIFPIDLGYNGGGM